MKQTVRLLAMRGANVGEAGKYLHETACMSPAIREMIGGLKVYLTLFGGESKLVDKKLVFSDEFSQWINDEVIPAISYLGWSTWIKTELSELGFLVADMDRRKVKIGKDLMELVNQYANIERTEPDGDQ